VVEQIIEESLTLQALQLPDTDWVQALADVFLHGVFKPGESRGA
jgi:hypothetical protein